ncbi:MAG: YHYH protein [Actinomycetes bacterium]
MIFHEDSHQVKHLSELDRRSFLKASGVVTGVALLSGLLEIGQANAATSVSLLGFAAFSKSVKITKNSKYYLVESSGIPDHQMMVGIKSWQQQVPTIQPYTGSNAWSIPIKPVISKSPMSAKNHFLRGAIAIAVNGVPIFNALNNRGDDALIAGELDDWGGHCGRADDYHYHIAPLHLQAIVGKKAPIAYALDGYPIYGETEVDGKKVIGLDSFNGHFDSKKNYHYHGTKTYPYINGGFKGVVSEIDGQVDPQSATKAFREAGAPLRGAVITGLERTGDNAFDLTYSLNNLNYHVKYSASLNQVDMQFIDANGSVRTESYRR